MAAALGTRPADSGPLELTDEQQLAIARRDGSLFLSAGAGTGKTAVLVERFVRAAREDGVPVESILAITFTEKAAAELKARVRERFLALGDRERARASEGAFISTVHGFCSRLLRAHALEAGLDPEFRVLDEPEAERLGRQGLDRALEDFLADGREPDRLEVVARYTPDKLERMVRTVHARLRSRGERQPALPEMPVPEPRGEGEALARAVEAALTELGPRAAENRTVAAALGQLGRCRDALAGLGEGQLADPELVARLSVSRGNAAALATAVFDDLARAHEAYLDVCRAVREVRDYLMLRDLLGLYGRRYRELKEARSALDFEDLELIARDLLLERPGVRELVCGRFAHVMVDEFQDTNPLQHALLELVARGNLFTVGDELQSIYGFRHADVGAFRARRQAAEAAGRSARLATSFRARPAILELLNAGFGRALEGFEPLVPAREEPAAADSAPPALELLVTDRDRRRWVEAVGDEGFGAAMRALPPWRAAEARLLAERVRGLMQAEGFGPGDVAVLVRAASDMAAYERALSARGLPTYVVGGRGYWSQQQVGDLRAYLAALANPRDELALVSALASPLVSLSLDSVALLALEAKERRRGLWRMLAAGEWAPETLPAADRDRLEAFLARLPGERRMARRLSLETLIDRVVTGSGYDRAVLAMPAGERRLANVRKLMRLARAYESREGRDLRGFIDFLAAQDLLGMREGEAPLEVEGMDAIRIMTIHAAKGLEFPVVCVADLGREARNDDTALRITDDGRIGLSIASMGGRRLRGAELERIEAERAAEQEREERRILYVAATRARERLILSGATDMDRWPEPKPLGAPMNWLWRAFAPELPEAAGRAAEGTLEPASAAGALRFAALSPRSAEDLLPAEARAPVPAADRPRPRLPPSPPRFAEITATATARVGRLSYSSLESYERCGYRFYLERVLGLRAREAPAAGAAPGGLPGTVRGAVVHELLERLDFRRPVVPSRAEVERRLAAHGVARPESEVDGLRRLVEGFIGSGLFDRLSAADGLRSELPFAFELEADGAPALLINGVVDVHAREGSSALVVDYKSDRLERADERALVEERYGVQRLVYALAALRAGAERVEVVYCFLERPERPVAAAFSASDRRRLERELAELVQGVVAGRFEPTDRPHRELCASCPGQPALCSHGPERTLADPP